MKAPLLATFTLLSLGGMAIAESAIPTAFTRERYQETLTASPFALATPVDKPAEEAKDSPLNNLVVTGMGKLDDGRDFVIVQRVGEEGSMRFEGLEKNKEGLAVKQVKWGQKWDQSLVKMTFGNEEREIRFKENTGPTMAAAPPPGGGAGQRGPTGAALNAPPPIIPSAGNRPGVPKPGGATTGIPRPTGAMQVPRPGSGAQLQTNSFRSGQNLTPSNSAVPVPTNGGAPRQRVRSINNR